jgi:hypothetical protein
MAQIIYNGQQYNDIDQMPPEVREAYENAMKAIGNIFADNDHNGMPDVLENATSVSNIQTTYQVKVNGQVYKNPEDLPANLRPIFEQLAKQSDGRNTEEIKKADEPAIVVSENQTQWIDQQTSAKYNNEPVIQPVEGKPAQLIILLALGVILVALIIVALILFR